MKEMKDMKKFKSVKDRLSFFSWDSALGVEKTATSLAFDS